MEVKETLPDTEIIGLQTRPTIVIGSSYTDDVYYQYKNLITPRMAVIRCEDDSYVAVINGRKRYLNYGDEIRIEKLWIYYLNKVLLIHAYEGDMRISRRKEYAAY